jgi:hypothetical protein
MRVNHIAKGDTVRPTDGTRTAPRCGSRTTTR